MKQATPKAELPNEPAARQRAYKEFLDNPVFEEAIRNYRDQIVDAWIHTSPEDPEKRERLWYAYQSLLSVKGNVLRASTKSANDLHLAILQYNKEFK